jgi:photosystem II stability/assembly factor-like uncharacterized protein
MGGHHTDDLPEELRRLLRSTSAETPGPGREELLARVRTGARRRRARRTAVAGSAAAFATAAVVAVAGPLISGDDAVPAAGPSSRSTDAAASTLAADADLEPGTPVDPADVRVRSVTAASSEEFWVLGDARCPEGRCTVVGTTDDAASTPLEFRAAPGVVEPSEAVLRTSGNAEDGWLVSDGDLYSTHDAGSSWKHVPTSAERVDDVVASAGSVWVRGEAPDGTALVATAPTDTDAFIDTASLPADEADVSELVLTEATGGGRRLGFLSQGAGAVEFLAFDEARNQWQAHATPGCEGVGMLSGTSSALWAICELPDGDQPMVSTDGGTTWELVEVDQGLGAEPGIAAIDEDTAFVSTGIELYVLEGDQLLRAEPPADGSGSRVYDYLGFHDDATGYLIDADGVLSRSTNGGSSWEAVDLP